MKRQIRVRVILVALAALSVTPVQSFAQQAAPEWHPALKELWQDLDDWKLITPSDVKLSPDRLVGLRAVYHREESLLSNPLIEEAGFQFEKGWLRGESPPRHSLWTPRMKWRHPARSWALLFRSAAASHSPVH